MSRLVPLALVGAVLVALPACQCGLSRPGMEFRIFRPAVALEPRLVDSRSNTLSALSLEPEGRRSFERGAPPSTLSFPAPEVSLGPPLVGLPPVQFRGPPPAPVALDACTMGRLLDVLDRVSRQLGPEKVPPPRAAPCP